MKPRWQRIKVLFYVFLVTTLLLMACEGTTPQNPTTSAPGKEGFTKVGSVAVANTFDYEESNPQLQKSALASGGFYDFEQAVKVQDLPMDECFERDQKPFFEQVEGTSGGSVLVGEITLNKISDGSLYTKLHNYYLSYKPIYDSSIGYKSDNLTEVTEQLSLNIKEGTFPGISNTPMPPIPNNFELSVSNGDFSKVNKDTVFTWTGQGSDKGRLILYFDREKTYNYGGFYCYAKDDGEFAFPDVFKGQLEMMDSTSFDLDEAIRWNYQTIYHPDKEAIFFS